MTGRRVLLVHPTAERYGGDKALLLLTAGLARRGWDVRVALPTTGPLTDALDAEGIPWVLADTGAVRRVYTAGGWLRFALRDLPLSIVRVRRLAREVDLVHVNSSVCVGGLLGGWAARRPVVLHVRESYADHPAAWRAYAHLPGRCADAVLVISRAIRDEAALAGFGDRVRVVPDGIELPAITAASGASPQRAPAHDANEPRDAHDTDDVLHVVAVGRLNDWKGHEVLVDAIAGLRRRGIRARCTIAGGVYPGQEPICRALQHQIHQLGLDEAVDLPGFVGDVEGLVATASVFVLASTRPEPFGLALVEAMAQGATCIATAHGGPVDIIDDGVTGVLVSPGDPTALVDAIEGLWGDPGRRAAMGAAAAASVRERFGIERTLEQVEAIYQDLLG